MRLTKEVLLSIVFGIVVTALTWNIKHPVTYPVYGIIGYSSGFPLKYNYSHSPAWQDHDLYVENVARLNILAVLVDSTIWGIFAFTAMRFVEDAKSK